MTLSAAHAAGPDTEGSRPDTRSSDAALTGRIAEGDARALAQAIDAHFPSVFAVACRMVGTDADAEDIAQDVFMVLWRKPPDLSDGRAALGTWLYRVASNRSIDWLRRKRPQPLDDALELPSGEAGPEASAAGAQVTRSIDGALARLPDRQRLALALTYYQGLSNIEAASIMDVSVDALESLLSRARRRIKEELKDDWRDLLDAISFSKD